jgi:hypothetical protein
MYMALRIFKPYQQNQLHGMEEQPAATPARETERAIQKAHRPLHKASIGSIA